MARLSTQLKRCLRTELQEAWGLGPHRAGFPLVGGFLFMGSVGFKRLHRRWSEELPVTINYACLEQEPGTTAI